MLIFSAAPNEVSGSCAFFRCSRPNPFPARCHIRLVLVWYILGEMRLGMSWFLRILFYLCYGVMISWKDSSTETWQVKGVATKVRFKTCSVCHLYSLYIIYCVKQFVTQSVLYFPSFSCNCVIWHGVGTMKPLYAESEVTPTNRPERWGMIYSLHAVYRPLIYVIADCWVLWVVICLFGGMMMNLPVSTHWDLSDLSHFLLHEWQGPQHGIDVK